MLYLVIRYSLLNVLHVLRVAVCGGQIKVDVVLFSMLISGRGYSVR